MSSSDSNDEDDHKSFEDLMKGVKPLKSDKIEPDSAPKPKSRRRESTDNTAGHITFGESEYVTPVSSDATLSFVRGGIQQKLMTKLKKGLLPFEAKIDLHGATVAQAGKELQTAIDECYEHGLRCILVVHGRGKGSFDSKPALKTHVNHWLRDTPKVLASHTAQPKHGGKGAVYVLLKRQRQD